MLGVRVARPDDLVQWLELVAEVEPLFGPMPDFADHAVRGITRGSALVAAEGDTLEGACLLSRDDLPHAIRWLAVREGSRRRGAGSLILRAIEERWPTGDISVVTFGSRVRGGAAARRFYEARGFEARGPAAPGPDGSGRDLYVLARRAGTGHRSRSLD